MQYYQYKITTYNHLEKFPIKSFAGKKTSQSPVLTIPLPFLTKPVKACYYFFMLLNFREQANVLKKCTSLI